MGRASPGRSTKEKEEVGPPNKAVYPRILLDAGPPAMYNTQTNGIVCRIDNSKSLGPPDDEDPSLFGRGRQKQIKNQNAKCKITTKKSKISSQIGQKVRQNEAN